MEHRNCRSSLFETFRCGVQVRPKVNSKSDLSSMKRGDVLSATVATFVFAGIVFVTSGCAGISERNLLTVPVVSMTHSKLPKDYRLQSGNSFLTEFCEDDRPIVNTGKVIGLADQAILKAQKRHKATHLLDVRVVREGDCVIAEGTTARAVRVEKRTARSRNAMLAPKLLMQKSNGLGPDTSRMPAAIPSIHSGSNFAASIGEDADEFIFTNEVLAPDADAPPGLLDGGF